MGEKSGGKGRLLLKFVQRERVREGERVGGREGERVRGVMLRLRSAQGERVGGSALSFYGGWLPDSGLSGAEAGTDQNFVSTEFSAPTVC